MAGGPVPGQTPALTRLAQWAVALAFVGMLLLALAFAGLGFGGAGVMVSLAAFALAVAAKVQHQRWALLWLPLLLFPALVVTAPFWV